MRGQRDGAGHFAGQAVGDARSKALAEQAEQQTPGNDAHHFSK